jgi:hypothetical protein
MDDDPSAIASLTTLLEVNLEAHAQPGVAFCVASHKGFAVEKSFHGAFPCVYCKVPSITASQCIGF